ncbi:Nif3-like dinuclear metal center hexameric protein [Helicobacter suis]|uniref:Nif3-like dinuclear metal center hexameric protein n=1 Tax=Helicobacter suis TaxID=104628 RepID=UPI0013D7649D|nr:Nif3-like dinuclear metal center hexameric protein [Helicobacter suis]
MLSLKVLYNFLNQLSPFDLQESWDNSGLNLGSFENSYENIAIALEATLDIAREVPEKTIILTHHPLFFKPIKTFNPAFYPANIASKLLEKSCALVAMHTNFDKTHLNAHFARILGFNNLHEQGMALIGSIEPISLETLASHIQAKLNLSYLEFVKGNDLITKVALICGSGCSYLYQLQEAFDNLCLITGDVKYHDAMYALSMGISLLNTPHYESEKYFMPLLENLLQPYLAQTKPKCVKLLNSKNPFILKV